MAKFYKPRVVVSRCIEFDHCRWNGLMIASDVVKLLKSYVEFIPVCAEVEIGLGVPREPVRIVEVNGVQQLYQPATDKYWTDQMQAFAASFLDALPEVDGFILKSRSPSCGIKDVRVYPQSERGIPSQKGVGFFARAVLERFPYLPIEDEGRLTNLAVREHFLARLFTLAAFRGLESKGAMEGLVHFHARNKLLLMAHNQQEMRVMGRIVANHERKATQEVYREYGSHLRQAMSRPARLGSVINVLMHAFGYFKEGLSSAEKAFFLDCLEDYRAGRVPMSVPTSIIRSWIVRFGQEYLADQTFFEPYPEGLIQMTDSGKGRKIPS